MSETTEKEKPKTFEKHRKFSLFPKTLADCIEPVAREALKSGGLAGSKLITQWSTIVGEGIAQRCLPEKLTFPRGQTTGGTLVLSVQSGFAPHVQHMQPMILERLATYFGYAAVARILISHSWAQAPAPPKPAARKPVLPKGSFTITNEVEDPELRAALESLAKTLAGE